MSPTSTVVSWAWASAHVAVLLGSLTALGCGLVVHGEEVGDEDSVADDIVEYEQLAAALDSDREQILGDQVVAVRGRAAWLSWIDGSTLGLRRYPDQLALELPAPSVAHRVSDAVAITIEADGSELLARAYALPSADLIDEQSLAGEPASARLAMLDEVAWLAVDDQIWEWRVGVEPPVVLGSLADAGLDIEELVELDVVEADAGPQLVLHADAELWLLDTPSFTAVAVAEIDELLAVNLRGVLFTRGEGLYLYEFPHAGDPVRVDEAIAATGWSLNSTFAGIHEYAGDGATLAGDRVYYIASAGLFGYALDELGPAAITPILIEPRWDVDAGISRVEYREPNVAGDRVFVRGLTGSNGEIGETGPIHSAPREP